MALEQKCPSQNVKTILEEMDSILYSECLQGIDLRESKAHQEETKWKEKWERIEMAAARNQFNHHVACVSH